MLTEDAPSQPFPAGGKFRLIDPLVTVSNSGIANIAVLTSTNRAQPQQPHPGIGKPWDLDRPGRRASSPSPIRAVPTATGEGTAGAVRLQPGLRAQQQEEHVLILAGDHIY